jgi:MFS family permease
MNTTQPQRIGWDTIFALAALDAAVVISWTAYHNFQPKLLSHFHFEHLSRFVTVAQAIVMLTVPIVAGWATDYFRKKTGSGFSVFAVGISVASLIFMAVSFTISDQAFINLVWLLPALIVFWLISMNIFHSPANAVLEAFSKNPALPLMMSVLVISKIVIHGIEPLLLHSLEEAGGAYTFLTGGVILVITGVWFARSTKNMALHHSHDEAEEQNRFVWVVLFGLLAGLVNSLILHFFPEILRAKFGAAETIFQDRLYISAMLGLTALATVPLSFVVKRKGIFPSLIVGLIVAFAAIVLILVSTFEGLSIAASAVLACAYGLVLITAFPHALHNIKAENATLGTGLFFASFEFFEVLFRLTSGH